jgi:hypothetical protein
MLLEFVEHVFDVLGSDALSLEDMVGRGHDKGDLLHALDDINGLGLHGLQEPFAVFLAVMVRFTWVRNSST